MARRSRMSILKRQRELKNSEKAARKRARRHGRPEPGILEPQPTASLTAVEDPPDDAEPEEAADAENERI